MQKKIFEFLEDQAFFKMDISMKQFQIFYKRESSFINVIMVMEDIEGIGLQVETYKQMQGQVKEWFAERTENEIHTLSLLLTGEVEKAKEINEYDRFSWIFDRTNEKLIVFENQISEFYGIREKLENYIHKEPIMETYEKKEMKTNSYINIILVGSNILIFLVCTFMGRVLYNIGGLEAGAVLIDKEYYRIFTSAFLHADANHLISNMLLLYFAGDVLEKQIGHMKYILLYFIAMIGSGVASLWFQVIVAGYSMSIGASGAVFGVIGALFFAVIVNRGRIQYITTGKMLFLIAYSLYSGFRATNIDNAGHVGGLLAGIFIMIICYVVKWIFRIGARNEN